jgi:hypothetical protein
VDPTNPNDFTHLHVQPDQPNCLVLYVSRDADMRRLVTTGLIWRGGPQTIRRAVTWLIANPEVALTRVPGSIAAYVTRARA